MGDFSYYGGGQYIVGYLAGKVRSVTREWGASGAVSLPAARYAARRLLPSDARLQRRGSLSGDRLLEVYRSRSVERQFPRGGADPWLGGERGLMAVVYRLTGGRVSSMTVEVGGVSAER
ncbi:MAG: hypothetical protein M3281_09305 [Chloroflexota bacterium]|nr:hypothetical protein [Chloroflexota bacterium]